MEEQIRRGLEEVTGSGASEEIIGQMSQFIEGLLEKNKVMNLTAITQVDQVVGLHLLDSAALQNYLPTGAASLIDIGTGAGFPGIPLKILNPNLDVTLMDALQKRLDWLEEMGEELGLEGLYTLHGRGEELPHEVEHREAYEVATARAVADLRILSELVLPFVKVGGKFLAMKSCDSDQEIKEAEATIAVLGGAVSQIVDYDIPEMKVSHRLVVIDKIAPTPEKYPRRWAKIKKDEIKS